MVKLVDMYYEHNPCHRNESDILLRMCASGSLRGNSQFEELNIHERVTERQGAVGKQRHNPFGGPLPALRQPGDAGGSAQEAGGIAAQGRCGKIAA